MLAFIYLEKSILDAIGKVERPSLPMLSEVLSTAVVGSRENTGHGFYTKLTTAVQGVRWAHMIDGPSARMLNMGDDAVMGFILWCSDQGPTTLEGFQFGDSTRKTVDLRTRDLGELRFSELLY